VQRPALAGDDVPHEGLVGVDVHEAEGAGDGHQGALPVCAAVVLPRSGVLAAEVLDDVALRGELPGQEVEGFGAVGFGAPDVQRLGAVAVVLRDEDGRVRCALCGGEGYLAVVEEIVDGALEIVLQHFAADLVGAGGEGAEALEAVVVDEALLGEVLDGLADYLVGERLSLYAVHALLVLELAVSQCDGELVAHQITQLQVVPAIFEVANRSIEQRFVEGRNALGGLALDAQSLDGTRTPVLGARKIERFRAAVELASKKSNHLHSVLVLLVQREVQVLSTKLLPAQLATSVLGVVSIGLVAPCALVVTLGWRVGLDSNRLVVLHECLEEVREEATERLVRIGAGFLVEDGCRGHGLETSSFGVFAVTYALHEIDNLFRCLLPKDGVQKLCVFLRKLQFVSRALITKCHPTIPLL
jgi:hypothetical protein